MKKSHWIHIALVAILLAFAGGCADMQQGKSAPVQTFPGYPD